MQYFNNIILIVILLNLNVKSETVLPETFWEYSWFSNKICSNPLGVFYKNKTSYKKLPTQKYWQYFSHTSSNYYGYYFKHEESYERKILLNSKLTFSNNIINVINLNEFIIFSEKWFEGLDLKHSLLSQESVCTWYEDKENIYPVLCGTADKILYCPNFRGGFNWQIGYSVPFIIKLTLNRQSQKVISHQIIEYPYSISDRYYDAIYLPTPAPLNSTNYILVTNNKNGFEENGDKISLDIELIGILDNGKVFMQKSLLKKTNLNLRFIRFQWFSNNTYFLSYNFYSGGNSNIFNKRKIIKVGNINFININAELPDNYYREDVCFYKKNVVLAGSIDGVATVITLKYTNDKVIRKIYKLPKVNFEKYDRLMTILRPDHYVDIVLSKNQIEEDVERELPIIYTVNFNKNDEETQNEK